MTVGAKFPIREGAREFQRDELQTWDWIEGTIRSQVISTWKPFTSENGNLAPTESQVGAVGKPTVTIQATWHYYASNELVADTSRYPADDPQLTKLPQAA